MSPILYIEARCDNCNDEIFSDLEGVEFSIMRNGAITCKACAEQRPDSILKWFTVPKLPEPKEDPTAEEVMKDIEALEETPEEEPEG